jgi:hypothetical protein
MRLLSQIKLHASPRMGAALFFLAAVLLMLPQPAQAQQNYVSRYDLFAGYSFLNSPHVKLCAEGAKRGGAGGQHRATAGLLRQALGEVMSGMQEGRRLRDLPA